MATSPEGRRLIGYTQCLGGSCDMGSYCKSGLKCTNGLFGTGKCVEGKKLTRFSQGGWVAGRKLIASPN